MTDDERQFLERLQSGDEPAWQQFALAVQPIILSKLKQEIGDHEKANDIASEIMVALVANLRKIAIDPARPQ